jgi:hypothetical protein
LSAAKLVELLRRIPKILVPNSGQKLAILTGASVIILSSLSEYRDISLKQAKAILFAHIQIHR